MTAKLVSENSQALSASAFAMDLLGSCFGTCVPKMPALQSILFLTWQGMTMKRPARRGAESCLIWHCLRLFPRVSTSGTAAELLHHLVLRMRIGEMVKRSHLPITQCPVTSTLCRDWYPSSGVECGSGVMLHSYVKFHFWTSSERFCCIHSQQWAGRQNGNAMVEFAFAADPCMTCESSSSPDFCFALPRIQSSVSLAWLAVFLLSWLSGRSAASFPETDWVFQLSSVSTPVPSCQGSHLCCCSEVLKKLSKGDAALELRSWPSCLAWKAALGTVSMRFLLQPSLCAFLKK